MSENHKQWLKELDEASRHKQEQFLNHIASKLQRARITEKPSQPYRGAPQFWQQYDLDEQEKIEMFTQNFQAAGGYVLQAATLDAGAKFIADKAQEMKAHYILRQDTPQLEALQLEALLSEADVMCWNEDVQRNWIALAAQSDIGVVLADHAVAYTGSIVLKSSKAKGRAVSLLPTVLIALIPRSKLVTRLGEVLGPLDDGGRVVLPAGVHFVSGPSRSADIENDLTIGVHGPGIVYGVIVNDL